MTSFTPAERLWIEHLGSLRAVVRQEIITRQLAPYVSDGMVVLDVGCGQGTQALRLASSGCLVTGIDPSPELLQLCVQGAASRGLAIEALQGRIEDLEELCGDRMFDMICCHGVMMYAGRPCPGAWFAGGTLDGQRDSVCHLPERARTGHAPGDPRGLARRPIGLRFDQLRKRTRTSGIC